MDVEDTLRLVPLFAELQPKQIRSLARWATSRTYSAGQVIVLEGQTGMGLYFIQSGEVKITKQSAHGEREIRRMGPGESFGEIALLDDKPRSATVTAVEPTTTVVLDKSQFIAELRTYPEIALAILPTVVGWLRDADAVIAQLS